MPFFLQNYGFSVTWILKSLEKGDDYNTIKVRLNDLVINDATPTSTVMEDTQRAFL